MTRQLRAIIAAGAFGAALTATAISSAQATVRFDEASLRPSSANQVAIVTPVLPPDWNFVVGLAAVTTSVAGAVSQLLPKSSSSSSSSASGYTGSGTDFGEHYDPAALDLSGFDK